MKIVITFCIIISGLYNCREDNDNHKDYKSTGKIIGPDLRMCPSICCGGYNIQINNLLYKFESIPNNSNINLQKDTFPIFVKLDWQLSQKYEGCQVITIQRITKE